MEQIPGRIATMDPASTYKFLGHHEHAHSEPHLIYVAVGSARIEIEGEHVHLAAGESVWLAPQVPHSARYTPGSLVLGPFLSPTTLPPERVHRLGAVPAVMAVMTGILGVAPSTAEQIAISRNELDEVLTSLRRPQFALPVPTHPVAAAIAAQAPLSSESLDELAARHRTSTRHVQRLFLAETGIPFRQWRTRSRLNIAIDRLRSGASLRRAALASGFHTPSGLRKALIREVGADAESWCR